MKAILTLEGGQFGIIVDGKTVPGEIVFNTSMTGVTELLTDPSSMGQILLLTYPMIGNCGVSYEDFQSAKPQLAALIVSELSEIPSNFRSEDSLRAVLERFSIPVVSGIDTRSVVRLLRSPQKARLSIDGGEAVEKPFYSAERRSVRADKPVATIAVLDTGMRRDLERILVSLGISLEIFSYGDAIEGSYDGYLLPSGPGDPAGYDLTVVKKIIQTGKPVLAVGLGHQLLALANGAKTIPLSPGHRGANIPVRDVRTGKVTITQQNHGYTVGPDTASGQPQMPVSHVNVNDGSVEGLRWQEDVISVQFLPTKEIINEFVKILGAQLFAPLL